MPSWAFTSNLLRRAQMVGLQRTASAQKTLHLPASAHSLSVGGSMRDDCFSTNALPAGAKLPIWVPAPALNCLRSPSKLTCHNCCSRGLPSFEA